MNTPDTPTPRTDGAVWSPYEETIVVVVDADFARQLERELTAAKEENANLKTARDADFEIFHQMRVKLTAACGDPYKLNDEALDAVLAELALLRTETLEQARLLGMSGEREADLRG